MRFLFHDTLFEDDGEALRLRDRSGRILVELRDRDLNDAVRRGEIDLACSHYSLFEYARRRGLAGEGDAITLSAELRRGLENEPAAEPARDEAALFDEATLVRLYTVWN